MIENFENWLGNTKATIVTFGVLTLICYFIPMAIDSPYVLFPCLVMTFVFPFLIGVSLLTGNVYYKELNEHAWFRATKRLLLISYTIFSGVWAANEVNEVFSIGASNFPVTVLVYTLVYALVAYIKPVAAYLTIINILFVSFLVIAWLMKPSLGKKLWIYVLFTVVLSATAQNIANLEKNRSVIIPKIAVFADFHSSYRCKKEPLGQGVKGVIFMSNGKVFIHREVVENNSVSWLFDIKPCEI